MIALKLAWESLRASLARTVAVGVAVGVGACLLSLTSILGDTAGEAVSRGLYSEYGAADVVVQAGVRDEGAGTLDDTAGAQLETGQVARIAALPGVSQASGLVRASAVVRTGEGAEEVRGISVESLLDPGLRWQRLESGSWPATDTQIALSAQTAAALGVGIGEELLVGKRGVEPGTMTVTGLVDTRGSVRHDGVAYGIVGEAGARRLAGIEGISEVRVAVTAGTSPEQVVDAVNALSPGGWPMTVAEAAGSTADLFESGLDAIAQAVRVLVGVSFLVTALVLATTYTITLSARSRALALLRCVGATRAQVFGSVVVETLLVGLAAGAAGVLVAVLIGYGAVPLLHRRLSGISAEVVTVSPSGAILLPVLAAAVLTVLAGLLPAWRGARVPAVAALGVDVGHAAPRRVPRSRLVGVVVAAAAGIALLLTGAGALPRAGLGVALLAVGLVAAMPLLVRAGAALAGLLGRLLRWPTGILVAANVARNPRRSGAIALTVLVGCLLCSASWVALDSLRATALQRVSDKPSIDVIVGDAAGSGTLSADTPTRLAAIAGVEAVQPVRVSDEITMTGTAAVIADTNQDIDELDDLAGEGLGVSRDDGTASWAVSVAALTQSWLDAVSHVPYDLTGTMDDRTVYLEASAYPPFDDSRPVALAGPLGQVRDVRVVYVANLPVPAMVTPALFERLAATSVLRAAWVRTDAGADRAALLGLVRAQAVLDADQAVTGTLPVALRIDGAVDLVAAVVTALLGVAVAISLIGVANALALSVVERRQENALLRALGLDREQLGGLLVGEATLLTLLGAVLGVAGGVGLGLFAVHLAADAFALTAVVAMPVLVLALGVVVMVTAGRSATALPAARAARLTPARGLAA
ncbi:FtsX-like permease family protein [Nocardioides sp.]|uniref:FtsX-like permease family protein n=1 Tax=Nocardioides sp. TaxID=35761 RepID=UPI0039E664FC